MMMGKIVLAMVGGICLLPMISMAEDASANAVTLTGYLETYYVRDFNSPQNNKRPDFTYSHNRANGLSVNLALIKAAFSSSRTRANLALASGTYMRANYAVEPKGLQKLYEANVGVKLLSDDEVWFDVGLMPSHIGFESAIGIENWTMTRSLMAENSPYFETGARLSYTTQDGKWYMSGLLLNGWQRINRPDGNTTPAIGHQLTYKPNQLVTLNSSSFIGNDKSDRDRQMRYFHNFYGQFKLTDQWSLTTAFDIGAEERGAGRDGYNVWFTPVVIAKYQVNDQLSISGRAEYYQDRNGVIISTNTPHGFRTLGYSLNADYKLNPKVTLRAEVREFKSKDDIFDQDGRRLSGANLMAATAVALSF